MAGKYHAATRRAMSAFCLAEKIALPGSQQRCHSTKPHPPDIFNL
jgi:hypothetical protein